MCCVVYRYPRGKAIGRREEARSILNIEQVRNPKTKTIVLIDWNISFGNH